MGAQQGSSPRLGCAIALGSYDPTACRHRPRPGPLPAQRGRGGDGLLLLQLRRPVGRAAAPAPGPGGVRGGHGDDRGRDLLSSMRLFRPLQEWRERLLRGADPGEVPAHLRRRALNRPLIAAAFSMTGWTLAAIFYLPYQLWVVGFGLEQAWRVFAGIVFVGGPVASALAFLVAEDYSRRALPLFFPAGRVARTRVLRVPIPVRP